MHVHIDKEGKLCFMMNGNVVRIDKPTNVTVIGYTGKKYCTDLSTYVYRSPWTIEVIVFHPYGHGMEELHDICKYKFLD